MLKRASKWTAMLRAGKLAPETIAKAFKMSPKGVEALAADSPDVIKSLRSSMSSGSRGGLLPLSDALAAGDSSAIARMASLKNRPVGYFNNLPDANRLQKSMYNQMSDGTSPFTIGHNIPKMQPPRQLVPGQSPPPQHWLGSDKSLSGAAYNRATNTVHGRLGTAVNRHELGHWKAFNMALNNPTALNTKTIAGYRRLEKSAPAIAQNMLNPPLKNAPAMEFQAQMLAATGG